MLKILLLTHKFYPNVGGTEANAEFLAQAFLERGASVHIATWTSETGEKVFSYQVLRNPGYLTLVKEYRWADVIFENSPVLRLSWPAMFFNKPIVLSINTWLQTEGQPKTFQARLKYLWLKKASKVIAVSDAVRKETWPSATVIENAYNNRLFVNRLPQEKRHKGFVFLGRLVSDKGADLAISAVARLYNMQQEGAVVPLNLTLTIIGDGKDLEQLKIQASELGVQHLITFMGSLTGEILVSCLNEHHYMLIPSRWKEPFGIVALEGMACGCIPVVADGGGLPDAVGKAGLSFKRGDLDDLVKTILNVINDQPLQDELRLAAKNHLELHAPDVIADQYFKIINQALKAT